MDVLSEEEALIVKGGGQPQDPPIQDSDCYFQAFAAALCSADIKRGQDCWKPKDLEDIYKMHRSILGFDPKPEQDGVERSVAKQFTHWFLENETVRGENTIINSLSGISDAYNNGKEVMVGLKMNDSTDHAVIVKGINADGTYNRYDKQNDSWSLNTDPSQIDTHFIVSIDKKPPSTTYIPSTKVPSTTY